MNPFLITDGYKTGHHKMYPEGTTLVYSNFTPRHGKHSNIIGGKGVISFGQQMVIRQIKEMFDNNFFRRDKISTLDEIKKEYSLYLGTDYDISHIQALWELGYLPIKVKALPEGTFVPYGVPVLTIVNTNSEFFWLTNFLETMISNMLWMPMTAATTAYEYKNILTNACLETDPDSIAFVDFQGHNFGMRGMAGLDATIYSGLGHATSFKGDDSLPTISTARKYYNETGFVVGSVNATEHSVMCAGGDKNELDTFRYLMKQFPTNILSIVSDTWNLWDVVGPNGYLSILKDEIMARDGKIVIRPDSGDPVDIICGVITHNSKADGTLLRDINEDINNPDFIEVSVQEAKGVIELLWDIFGGITNEQGYKVLDPHIGAIYGDSITLDRAQQICDRLKTKGFASTNVVLGIGSYTYQYVTRDTHGFAMKATYVEILPEHERHSHIGHSDRKPVGREIFKDPVTGDGTKKSAKGLLHVYKNGYYYVLQDQVPWIHKKGETPISEATGKLQIIFEDGKFYNETTLTEIRNRLLKNRL